MSNDTLYVGPHDIVELRHSINKFIKGDWLEMVVFTKHQVTDEFEVELSRAVGTQCTCTGYICIIEQGTIHLGREFPMLIKNYCDDPIHELDVVDAILIHDEVFGYHDTYSDPMTWTKYSLIIGTENGFIAGYVKDGMPHVSLAGVTKGSRGTGLFSRLIRFFADKMDSTLFTICTYPKKFPIMAGWIERHRDPDTDLHIGGDGKLSATIRL